MPAKICRCRDNNYIILILCVFGRVGRFRFGVGPTLFPVSTWEVDTVSYCSEMDVSCHSLYVVHVGQVTNHYGCRISWYCVCNAPAAAIDRPLTTHHITEPLRDNSLFVSHLSRTLRPIQPASKNNHNSSFLAQRIASL